MFQNLELENLLIKSRENKLAHAYLLETNNLELALNDLKILIKHLNCPHEYNESCTQCNLCNLINLNNLPSLIVIEPDGNNIKKNQIDDLKKSFDSIPIYSKYNTYIIKNAEKLNSSSANSMLKFVEEPTPGIIGFFLTTNKDIMIETIKSRCQTLILNYETNSLKDILKVSEEKINEYLSATKSFLNYLNDTKLLNNKDLLISYFSDRKDIENILTIILLIYYNYFLKETNQKYSEIYTNIYPISDNLKQITEKMQIINKILTNMSYNVSTELILDKLVIEMRGVS